MTEIHSLNLTGAFPTEIERTQGRCLECHLTRFGLTKFSPVSPQLFREVRIMKLLNHPNIGKFTQEAWLISSSIII